VCAIPLLALGLKADARWALESPRWSGIVVSSVDAIRSYYVDMLGFSHVMGMVGKDGQLDFCTVVLGEARIMFMRAPGGTPVPAGKQPVEIYLEVEDVDALRPNIRLLKIDIAGSPEEFQQLLDLLLLRAVEDWREPRSRVTSAGTERRRPPAQIRARCRGPTTRGRSVQLVPPPRRSIGCAGAA